MLYLAILGIILIILAFTIELVANKGNGNLDLKKEETYNNYISKKYVMTETELIFYKGLKENLEKENLNYIICPQVNLENIVKVKKYSNKDRNRIKSRTIDFTILSEDYKIKCCIELDDYTHNKPERIKRDIFINELFKKVNINLLRIKVNIELFNIF